MSQVPKSERVKANREAHIKAIADELETVNLSLQKKNTELNKVEDVLSIKKKEISDLENKIADINAYVLSKLRELEHKEVILQNREDALIESEKITANKIRGQEEALKNKIQLLNATIQAISDKEIILKSGIVDIENRLERERDLEKELLSKIEGLSKEKMLFEQDLEKMKRQLVEEVSEIDRAIEHKRETLNIIQKQILEEQDKVRLPLENLAKEERSLKIKQKNLDILIDRFKKYMEKFFPNYQIKL